MLITSQMKTNIDEPVKKSDDSEDISISSCVYEPVLAGLKEKNFESRLEKSFDPQHDRDITVIDTEGKLSTLPIEDLQFLAFVNLPVQIDPLNISSFDEVVETFTGHSFKIRIPADQDYDNGFFGIVTNPEDRYKYIFFPYDNIRIQYQQRLIGDIFVERNFLSEDILQNVLRKQIQLRGIRLGSIIAKRTNLQLQHLEKTLQKAWQKSSDKKLQIEEERLQKEANEKLQQEQERLLIEAEEKLRREEELLKKESSNKIQQLQKRLQMEADGKQWIEKEMLKKAADEKLQQEKKCLEKEIEKKLELAVQRLKKEANEILQQERERLRKLAGRKLQLEAEWLKNAGVIKRPTGDILIEAGLVSSQTVEQSLAIQKKMRHMKVGELFVEMGYINEDQMYKVLAEKFKKRFVDLKKSTPTDEALGYLSYNVIKELEIIPIHFQNERLVIATSNPDSASLSDILKEKLSCPFELVISPHNQIIEALANLPA
jgi:hypothetical protein